MTIKAIFLVPVAAVTLLIPSMNRAELAQEIVAMTDAHEQLSDQHILSLAQNICETVQAASLKALEPLSIEQALTAAHIFFKTNKMHEDRSCHECNKTPLIEVNPYVYAFDLLMHYVHTKERSPLEN